MVTGTATLKNPLVLALDLRDRTEDGGIGWKIDLAKELKAKGKALSRKLLNAGYDGIITIERGSPWETILLNPETALHRS